MLPSYLRWFPNFRHDFSIPLYEVWVLKNLTCSPGHFFTDSHGCVEAWGIETWNFGVSEEIWETIVLILLGQWNIWESWPSNPVKCSLNSNCNLKIPQARDVLVGGFNPSEKWWSSSVGMMTFPIYGKITNVPNHQPVLIDKSRNLNGWLFLVGSLDPFFCQLPAVQWKIDLKTCWQIPHGRGFHKEWYSHL